MTARTWLALMATVCSGASFAQGPGWAYAQYEEVWSRPQSDQEGRGRAGQLSLPLSQYFYASIAGTEMDEHFTDPSFSETDELESWSAGLGLHSTFGKAHAFGRVSYVETTTLSTSELGQLEQRDSDVQLALGARWLMTPWFSFEPEGGFSTDVFDGFVHVTLALRLIPHVWLLGGYTNGAFNVENSWSAGVRLSWQDASGPRPLGRGAKPLRAAPGEAAPKTSLAAGQTLQTLRLLRLQVRPLAGAPEIADLPAGTQLILQENRQNEFGTWWRVMAGDKEGWIRETELR